MAVHKGFDCYGDCSSWVDQTPDDIDFACRYLSHNPNKTITRKEAEAISAEDMQIVCVWESAGNHPEYFNSLQGRQDAVAAMAQMTALGAPEGSVIYFAVDCDITRPELESNVLPYFRQVMLTVAGHYKVGAYAPGSVLRRLKDDQLAFYFWVPNARGWSGYQAFLVSGDWHIKQGPNGDPWGTSVEVDTNESQGDDYGGWSIPQAIA